MNNRTGFLPSKLFYGCLAAAAALMLLGSFVDYPLSCALYRSGNPFATFFAAYGESPASLGWVAAGALLLCGHNRDVKWLGFLQCAGGALLAVFGTLMICVMPGMYLPFPPLALAAAGLALSAATIALTLRLARGADRRTMVRAAAAIFLVIFCELLVVNCIKVPWGRPRMHLVASNPDAFFVPWWQPGSELKAALLPTGVAAEEFKSFPSGHTANATVMLLLGLIPLLQPRLMHLRSRLLAFGIIWAAVVAFTRIVLGAHYLTDTTMGFVIGLLSVQLICTLLLRGVSPSSPKTDS